MCENDEKTNIAATVKLFHIKHPNINSWKDLKAEMNLDSKIINVVNKGNNSIEVTFCDKSIIIVDNPMGPWDAMSTILPK